MPVLVPKLEIFFYENTGLSFTIMSYILECMPVGNAAVFTFEKDSNTLGVDAHFSEAGEKSSVSKSIQMRVDRTLELAEAVGKEARGSYPFYNMLYLGGQA